MGKKKDIPDFFPAGGLIENRDGIAGAMYDDIEAVCRKYAGKLSRMEMIGALEAWKLRMARIWHDRDAEDDE